MNTTLWLPRVAVAHFAAANNGYGPPGLTANAAGEHTQLSADAIQFGFCVYEGMRVYLTDDRYLVFRSRDHHERMARSCAALAMPCPDYDTFLKAIQLIVEANDDGRVGRLYIRPVVFAAGGGIMPQQDRSYTYAALCTTFDPVPDGLKVLVEPEHPRTVPAFAEVKTATNYTSSALSTKRAQDLGYDTVLWLDDGYLRECTTMNVFVQLNGEIVTPTPAGILSGITRATVIELLAAQAHTVMEKELHITEVVEAITGGELSGIFTTSTALGISNVTRLRYRDGEYRLGTRPPDIVAAVKESYWAMTSGFSVGLDKYQGIAERCYVGARRK